MKKCGKYVEFVVFVWLVLTFSISPLFLLRAEREILTVTAFSSPWRRRAIRFGCRGLKEISSSGWGKRLVLPFSVEISEESSTDGQPAEPWGTHKGLLLSLMTESVEPAYTPNLNTQGVHVRSTVRMFQPWVYLSIICIHIFTMQMCVFLLLLRRSIMARHDEK